MGTRRDPRVIQCWPGSPWSPNAVALETNDEGLTKNAPGYPCPRPCRGSPAAGYPNWGPGTPANLRQPPKPPRLSLRSIPSSGASSGSKAVLGSLGRLRVGLAPKGGIETENHEPSPPECVPGLQGAIIPGFFITDVSGRSQAMLADPESDQGPQDRIPVAVTGFRIASRFDGSRRARETLCGSIRRLHGGITQCPVSIPTCHRLSR